MKFMVDDLEADKVRRLLETADVNYVDLQCNHVADAVKDSDGLRDAASLIDEGLHWDKTLEGGDYWGDVWNNLNYYAEMGEK